MKHRPQTQWQRDLLAAFDKHFPVGGATQKKILFKKCERVVFGIVRAVEKELAELEELRKEHGSD